MIGISLSEYEEMTPRQLLIRTQAYTDMKKIEAEEYKIKLQNNYEMAKIQAWHTANWARAKKMPDLDKVLNQGKTNQKVMTDEQMLNQVKALNAMFGGAVKQDGTKQ